MKLQEILEKTIQFFKDKKLDTPRLDAELLISHVLKCQRIELYLKYDQPLKKEEIDFSRELVVRRAKGEPVAYIVEQKDFYGFTFFVNKNVLIPRPETEHLVEDALEWLQKNDKINQAIWIADLGAGSGCVGLSLLKKLPNAKLMSVEVSKEAYEVIRINAEKLGVSDRLVLVQQDVSLVLQDELKKNEISGFDLIVSNPPYIAKNDKDVQDSVKTFEPHLALFADNEGMQLIQKWSAHFHPFMQPESLLLMEFGSTQGPKVLEHFQKLNQFKNLKIKKDLASLDRYIVAEKGTSDLVNKEGTNG